MPQETEIGGDQGYFKETLWNVVLKAKNKSSSEYTESLNGLINTYWKPVYFYIRRTGYDVETAKDLTQEFFRVFLEKDYLKEVEPVKGRFRTFILTALRHFLSHEQERAGAQKRGGNRIIISIEKLVEEEDEINIADPDTLSPENTLNQKWALTILQTALEKLRQEYQTTDRSIYFKVFKNLLSPSGDAGGKVTYDQIARRLGLTESDVTNYLHRARQRYRELVEAEIRKYAADETELKEELHDLFKSLAGRS